MIKMFRFGKYLRPFLITCLIFFSTETKIVWLCFVFFVRNETLFSESIQITNPSTFQFHRNLQSTHIFHIFCLHIFFSVYIAHGVAFYYKFLSEGNEWFDLYEHPKMQRYWQLYTGLLK